MKTPSIHCITLLTLALATAGLTPVRAADDGAAPAAGEHHKMMGNLSPAEQTQYKADKDKVLAANPELKTEEDALKTKMADMKTATPEDKKSYMAERKAHAEKVNAEIVKIDPSAQAIIDKMKPAHGKK